ncbi:MAG: hypothetical protein R6V41_04865 [Desulfobacteraceae bacterium]
MHKKNVQTLVGAIALFALMSIPAAASDTSHDGMAKHDMDKSGHAGKKIHEADVDGYHLEFRLIDMKEKIKDMENAPEMEDTHHLMVYVTNPEGTAVSDAAAGYLIENPDGTLQKKMAMAMTGGFGADISLDQKGDYAIKVKVLAENKKLTKSFSYKME